MLTTLSHSMISSYVKMLLWHEEIEIFITRTTFNQQHPINTVCYTSIKILIKIYCHRVKKIFQQVIFNVSSKTMNLHLNKSFGMRENFVCLLNNSKCWREFLLLLSTLNIFPFSLPRKCVHTAVVKWVSGEEGKMFHFRLCLCEFFSLLWIFD